MTSSSFRDDLSHLGWSRRAASPSATTSSPSFYGTISRYIPWSDSVPGALRLPIHQSDPPGAPLPARTRREEDEAWFALSRWDRIWLFVGLNLTAAALFLLCFTLLPVLSLRPRKFAILWSVASVLFLASWAVMMGPVAYGRHLVSPDRWPFTATYLASIALTLYFALGLRSTLLTLVSSLVQLVAAIWYLVSYFPLGSPGLRFLARFGGSRMASYLPT